MNTLEEKIEVITTAMLYILKQVGGRADFHKLFKILYFAEQKHLVRYGSAICEDSFHAMNNGPVPSLAYDIVKSLREGRTTYSRFFKSTGNHTVEGIMEPDMDCLSDSEKECLDEAIKENRDLDFQTLTDKSHDAAWSATARNRQMDIVKIAEAGGAGRQMVAYIEDNLLIKFAEFE